MKNNIDNLIVICDTAYNLASIRLVLLTMVECMEENPDGGVWIRAEDEFEDIQGRLLKLGVLRVMCGNPDAVKFGLAEGVTLDDIKYQPIEKG